MRKQTSATSFKGTRVSNIFSIQRPDENRSTLGEEIDAMDWDFSNLSRLLTELEKQPDESTRAYMVKDARRRLNNLVQRAYRAKQISRGLRVPKAN
jgi:hypothetical protein